LPGWSWGQPKEPPKSTDAPKVAPADDPTVRDLIEQGKFEEAKARLQMLRAKQNPDKAAGGNPRQFQLTTDDKAATLEATTADGKTLWKARLPDPKQGHVPDGKWTVEEIEDGKMIKVI